MNVSKKLAELLTESKNKGTSPYDTQGTVVRIDGDTAWVHFAGGVDETPVRMTVNASVGDDVQIRVSGGDAFLVGNGSAPPTDDTTAIYAVNTATVAQQEAETAHRAADSAVRDAERAADAAYRAEASATEAKGFANEAKTMANEAKTSAEHASEYASRSLASLSTVQSVSETLTWITQHGTMTLTSDTELDPTHVYFVVDANGDYVVGSTHYSLVTEPSADDLSTYYELSIDESLNNYVGTHLALTGEGLWLLPATSGTNKVLIATGAGTTYTTAGTYIINSTGGVEASFRSNGATVGQVLNGYSRTEIGTNGMQIVQRESGSDTQIAQLGYGLGQGESGTARAPYYTFGIRVSDSTVGNYSVAEGRETTASAYCSHAEGFQAVASGDESHAEGNKTSAIGARSHAEGSLTYASGNGSHAEGYTDTIATIDGLSAGTIRATAIGAHAEGSAKDGNLGGSIIAKGVGSHAEGLGSYDILAQGKGSHAEGCGTTATGYYSHAEGLLTETAGQAAHSQNEGTYASQYAQTAIGTYNAYDYTPSTAVHPNGDTHYGTYALIVGNGTTSSNRTNALTVDWNGNVDIASGAKYKINGTNLSASDVGAVPTTRTVNSKALSSNITLSASDVSALPLSGGTMTGQIKTSFQSSVAMGSYGASASTVPNLIDEVRLSSGCAGSASISTAYTKDGVTIATGWYNFFWMPHRSGGVNGTATGDNCNYGQLLLFGMNNTNGRFIVRVSSSAIQEVSKLLTSVEIAKVKTAFTPTSGSSYSTYGGCYYETYGNMVHVHVGVSGLTANTGTTIYTLPSAVRPSSTIFGHGTGGTATNIGYVEVRTTGVVYVYSNGSTYVGADVTYMI